MRRMITDRLTKSIKEVVAAYQAGEITEKAEVDNITSISDEILNKLQAGDVVVKKTGNQKHTYIVTYKEENQGICLTYLDASVVETQSYDYIDGAWVYNSQDKTNLANLLIENIKDSDGNNRFIKENITTETIENMTSVKSEWVLNGNRFNATLILQFAITTLSNNTNIASFEIPSYIYDNLIPAYSTNILAVKIMSAFTTGHQTNYAFKCLKSNNNTLTIQTAESLNITSARSVIVEFNFNV